MENDHLNPPDPSKFLPEELRKPFSEIKALEEEKRDRAYDPVQRWIAIQKAITWAEANMKPEFRRNRPRTHPANDLPPANQLPKPQGTQSPPDKPV
jgi:hypothetical protein